MVVGKVVGAIVGEGVSTVMGKGVVAAPGESIRAVVGAAETGLPDTAARIPPDIGTSFHAGGAGAGEGRVRRWRYAMYYRKFRKYYLAQVHLLRSGSQLPGSC